MRNANIEFADQSVREDPLLSVDLETAARLLAVDPRLLRRRVNTPGWPTAYRAGRQWRLNRRELANFQAGGRQVEYRA